MNLSEEYRFNDFTLSNYKYLLELALKNYTFLSFTNAIKARVKCIILRHDLEFSIPIALKMARIENELGIKATYLIQMHSEFYNVLEKNNFTQIKEIQKLGHDIGLHFDSHFWQIDSEENLERKLQIDKEVFNLYFGFYPQIFSFHNTNKTLLSYNKEIYAGMMNVYSKRLRDEFAYCTDSTGHWRYEVLEHKLKEAVDERLQILIHDGMWQKEILPPRRRVFKVIDDQARSLKRGYDNTLREFGAKNIDWNEIL
jgi:hypothetical protein